MVTIIKKGAGKKEIETALSSIKNSRGFDANKHCGVLNLKKDPMMIQKEMRDEWEQRLS